MCQAFSFIGGEKEASPICLSGRNGLDGDTPLLNVCKLLILDGDGWRFGSIWEVKKKNWRHGKGLQKKDNGVFVAKSRGICLRIKLTNFVMELFHIKEAWKIFFGEFWK